MIASMTKILRVPFSSKRVALPDGPSLQDFIETGDNFFELFLVFLRCMDHLTNIILEMDYISNIMLGI